MSDDLQSLFLPAAVLFPVLVAALLLAVARPSHRNGPERRRLVGVFLIGISCQCAHLFEEFATGLHVLAPRLLGLAPLPAEAFVGFNLFWIAVWVLSALGALRGARVADFPIWFFGLGMCLNGVVHPLLALGAGGYFPGLVTSPVVGLIGVSVTRRMFRLTQPGGP